MLADNDELQLAKQTCENAMKKFLKTRISASKTSIKNQHLLQINATHPIFNDKVSDKSETMTLLEQINHYKPKQSFIELQKFKQIKQGESVQSLKPSDQQFLSAIKNMARIESKKKQKLQMKEELKQQMHADDVTDAHLTDNSNKLVQDHYEIEFLNEPKSKKQKRSQITDFRHPTQYISAEPVASAQPQDQLERQEQITQKDINPFVIAEDYEDILKQNKKYVWDKKKRNFVKGKVDELGRIKRDKEDKQHQNSKNNEQWTRKQLQNWSKKNMIKIQKEGEVEDENVANQAKAMFEKRILKRKGFKFDRDQSQDKVLKYQREHRIRSELKGAKEIMN